MGIPLDHIAIIGYSALFLFAAYKLGDTMRRPVDLFANLLLLTGLGALITYHYRKITLKKDENNDPVQKRIRLVAHSTLVGFLLITLAPVSKSVFRFYDTFALVAHMILFVTVLAGMSQLAGVGLLAAYFLFAAFTNLKYGGWDTVQLVGRIFLLIFFTVSFLLGFKA